MLATYFVAVWIEDLFANAQMKGCADGAQRGKGSRIRMGILQSTELSSSFYRLVHARRSPLG